MVRAEPEFAWHLKRGEKIYGPVSHRELRLLAELGQLRPDDLLWRPGLGSWKSASSVSGTPLHQRDLTRLGKLLLPRMNTLFLPALKKFRGLTLSARQHARSVKGGLQHAYNRAAARWPNFDLVEAVRCTPQRGVLAGLLMIAVAVTALIAMKSTSATGSNAQIATITSKFHDRPSTPLLTNSMASKPAIDLSEAEVFELSNGHPTGRFVVTSSGTSDSQPEPVAQPQSENPFPVLEIEAIETLDEVPLPTRKPDNPSLKAQANTATAKRRTAQRPKGTEPKPMQFGVIGYNYSIQR
jgi:GYF domain 2